MKGVSFHAEVIGAGFPFRDEIGLNPPAGPCEFQADCRIVKAGRVQAMLSRSTGYSLKALVYLAARPPGTLAGAREIAAATGTPIPFLWKILRRLSHQNLIHSRKGVRGGYELARPANQIFVSEVIESTQRENPAARCILEKGACDRKHPCLLHDACADNRERIMATFERTAISDLMGPLRRKRRRPPTRRST